MFKDCQIVWIHLLFSVYSKSEWNGNISSRSGVPELFLLGPLWSIRKCACTLHHLVHWALLYKNMPLYTFSIKIVIAKFVAKITTSFKKMLILSHSLKTLDSNFPNDSYQNSAWNRTSPVDFEPDSKCLHWANQWINGCTIIFSS